MQAGHVSELHCRTPAGRTQINIVGRTDMDETLHKADIVLNAAHYD